MLLATACRAGEILSATWSNCDIDKKVLYINHEKSKSRKSRVIQLNDSAMEILKLSKTQGEHDNLFVNPRTKTRYYKW